MLIPCDPGLHINPDLIASMEILTARSRTCPVSSITLVVCMQGGREHCVEEDVEIPNGVDVYAIRSSILAAQTTSLAYWPGVQEGQRGLETACSE